MAAPNHHEFGVQACREGRLADALSLLDRSLLEQRLARTVSIQGSAVANLLLRAVALENALSGLTVGQGNVLAPLREDRADIHTDELIAEAVSRLSAHTSALNSVALRLLAIEGRVAELSARALRERQPTAKARWQGSLPSESSAKTLAAAPKIQLLTIHGVDGNTSVLELALLASLVKLAGGRAVFEFGTFDGRTAVNLAANCAPGGKVFTLDLPSEQANATRLPLDERDKVYIDKPTPGERYKGTPFETSIVQLHGDSAAFDFSRFYNAMDFVFIDASHKYEYVMNDTRIALRLLRDGRGTIAWHDYTQWWDGVVRALEELHATEPKLAGMRHIEGTDLVYARLE